MPHWATGFKFVNDLFRVVTLVVKLMNSFDLRAKAIQHHLGLLDETLNVNRKPVP